MPTFLDHLKSPTFWISLLGILGAVGAGLADTGNPTLIAIGAALTGVYTLSTSIQSALGPKPTVGTVTAAIPTAVTDINALATTIAHILQGWQITPKPPAAPAVPVTQPVLTPDTPPGPGGAVGTIPPFTQA